MMRQELLGSEFHCSCGKVHRVPTRAVIYQEDIIDNLPDIIREFVPVSKAAVVADIRTYNLAGKDIEAILRRAGSRVQSLIIPDPLPGRKSPVCDDKTAAALEKELDSDISFMIAVGSGVVNDLTKWCSWKKDLPYIAFATAASMNGYTSANVAAIVSGLKTIIYARPPVAVLAKPSIIIDAPYDLTAAGLGDVIAKPVSTADWLLNKLLFDEYYCEFCAELISDLESAYLDNPEAIKDRDPDAIKALFDGLIYSGVAMTIAGSSSPASGGEHLLSHTLDMLSLVDGGDHDLHGKQVGLGTIFAAGVYEHVLSVDFPRVRLAISAVDDNLWRHLASEVKKEYARKREKIESAAERIEDPAFWRGIVEKLRSHLRPASYIKSVLARAGAAHRLDDLVVDKERIKLALLHMHQIRSRFTIIDLARMVHILPEKMDELIADFLV